MKRTRRNFGPKKPPGKAARKFLDQALAIDMVQRSISCDRTSFSEPPCRARLDRKHRWQCENEGQPGCTIRAARPDPESIFDLLDEMERP